MLTCARARINARARAQMLARARVHTRTRTGMIAPRLSGQMPSMFVVDRILQRLPVRRADTDDHDRIGGRKRVDVGHAADPTCDGRMFEQRVRKKQIE